MTIRKRAPYKPMAERISHFATARLVREQSPGFRRLCALSRRFDESKKDSPLRASQWEAGRRLDATRPFSKARNIMDRLPKSMHAQVKRVLRQAWGACSEFRVWVGAIWEKKEMSMARRKEPRIPDAILNLR
jgi:hypothetical protein